MASPSYLAKCVFPSSVRHTGRASEARCTAAAGAETENRAQAGGPPPKWPSPVAENQPSARVPVTYPRLQGSTGAARPATLGPTLSP